MWKSDSPFLSPRATAAILLMGLAAVGVALLWLVEPRVGRLWLNTLWLAGGACLVAVPLGTLAAVGIVKTDAPGRRAAMLLLAAMIFVPLYLVAGAWEAGFGMQGWHTLSADPHLARSPWLDGWRGAVWVHGAAGAAWVALIVGAGLLAIEAEHEEDALLSAPPWRVLAYVTLPRAAPAMLVASLWVAILAAAEISATDLFQVRTFAEEVYTQSALGAFDFAPTLPSDDDAIAAGVNDRTTAANAAAAAGIAAKGPLPAASLWLGLALIAALAVAALALAMAAYRDLGTLAQRRRWTWRLGSRRWFAGAALWTVVLLVVGVPVGNLIYKAGVLVTATDTGRVRSWSVAKAIERIAAAPAENRHELGQSLWIGGGATAAALLVGVPLAWSMRLARRVPWIRLTALAVAATVPGPLLGIAVIRLLNPPIDSPLAGLAWLYDTSFAPWLVQTTRAVPIVTLILWSALASIPQAMLDAAAIDGAGWWGGLWRISLPQRWPAVAAAGLLALAVAVGELAATVLVMPPARHTVLSVKVFQFLHYGVDDRVAAICLVMIGSLAAVTAAAALLLRRMGRSDSFFNT